MTNHLAAGWVLLMTAGAASAAPPIAEAAATDIAPPHVLLVSGGFGFAFHRTPFGTCAPNRAFVYGAPIRRLPPPCPRFYHRDPDPARPICYPNV